MHVINKAFSIILLFWNACRYIYFKANILLVLPIEIANVLNITHI